MKISILFIFTVFIGCSIVLGSAFSQEDMIVVNTDAFKNPQRPPAIFRHDEHNAMNAITCMTITAICLMMNHRRINGVPIAITWRLQGANRR